MDKVGDGDGMGPDIVKVSPPRRYVALCIVLTTSL
jgi:hypothetical protein